MMTPPKKARSPLNKVTRGNKGGIFFRDLTLSKKPVDRKAKPVTFHFSEAIPFPTKTKNHIENKKHHESQNRKTA